MARNRFDATGFGTYYYVPATSRQISITHDEYKARRADNIVLYQMYVAGHSTADTIRCNCCYLGHAHSVAKHDQEVANHKQVECL